MTTILDKIILQKKEDVNRRKERVSRSDLASLPYYNQGTYSLRDRLLNTTRNVGMIAEMKKASPSKGLLQPFYNPRDLYERYKQADVEGISVLTDQAFFQGSFNDLHLVRQLSNSIPLLCKDFIIDPFQVEEAKGYGASVVLFIAAVLEENQYQELYLQAKSLHLEVLTEVHQPKELEMVYKAVSPEMIGINNRDLTTFQTSITYTEELMEVIPKETLVISESGITSNEQVEKLHSIGVRGVLVGEYLMKANDQTKAIEKLVGKR